MKKDKLKGFRIFNIPEEVVEWTNDHYTDQELESLDIKNNLNTPLADYKGSGYHGMNEYIRFGCIDDQDVFDIKGLQSFLSSKKLKDSVQVYRFVDVRELVILLWNTRGNKVYEYPGFLSTTLLKEYYSMSYIRQKRVAISIRIPKGTHGTYVAEVNPKMPEYEILLPYHTKLKRIGIMTFEVEGA